MTRTLHMASLVEPFAQFGLAADTTRKMIYCNTWDPLLVSAGNSS
jgi:hypothetical protein